MTEWHRMCKNVVAVVSYHSFFFLTMIFVNKESWVQNSSIKKVLGAATIIVYSASNLPRSASSTGRLNRVPQVNSSEDVETIAD
jgi:hypothetical protein